MELRALHALELPRVLQYLAGFTVSEAAFEATLSLRPYGSFEDVQRESALFEQGRLWAMHSAKNLTSFPSLGGLLQTAASPSAAFDLDDLFALRTVLGQGRIMVDAMLFEANGAPSSDAESLWPMWAERCRELPMPAMTISALNRCLNDDGHMRDEASPELSLVRSELRRLHQQCARKVKDYAAEYNILHYLQDTFMTLSSDRYVLPLKSNFKGRLQGVIHDYSQTGETCYFEPMFLVELNNQLQELKREEREEERKVLMYLSGLVHQELPGVQALYSFLVELDMLFARTSLADCYDGRMVTFEEGRGVSLKEARHPLLALALSSAGKKALQRSIRIQNEAQGIFEDTRAAVEEAASPAGRSQRVVASTLELLPGQHALVISGGNAGGKTVCLKSLGLITLMGLCALPVPVESGSVLPLWREVHAFIGDEQSLEDHVSTFTAQITHLGRIWPGLSSDTLVILDEFGAGTDPSQGAALAQAVVDSIMERGSYVVAATHFPALKAYALSQEGVRAASVLFDPGTKRPLFRLVYDQVGASQALDVAREHGLPESVLQRAEQYLLISGEDSSALVERLNTLAVEKEAELQVLAKEKASFAARKKQLQEQLGQERERLFASVQADAQQVLVQWKASRISHKQALKELARVRGELVAQGAGRQQQQESATPEVDLAQLTPRQRIRHIPWQRTGVLLEVDTRKKRVRLDFDGVSLWADVKDIALPEQSGRKKEAAAPTGHAGKSESPLPLRLDLRGMRADVALSNLEKFLDGAILSGRDVVEVIHGRGTGALRREVHNFLKSFPAARGYTLAPEDQGGDGMTIVELK